MDVAARKQRENMLPNKQQREQKIGVEVDTGGDFWALGKARDMGRRERSGRRLGGSGRGKWVPGLKHGARFSGLA